MKTKLYRKIVKTLLKTLYNDPRPSTHTFLTTHASMSNLRLAAAMWHSEKHLGHQHWYVVQVLREKYKARSRKYWTSAKVLERIIRNEGDEVYDDTI